MKTYKIVREWYNHHSVTFTDENLVEDEEPDPIFMLLDYNY